MMSRRKHKKRQNARKGLIDMLTGTKGTKKSGGTSRMCHFHDVTEVLSFRDGAGALLAGAQRSVLDQIDRGNLSPSMVIQLTGTKHDFLPTWPVTANAIGENVLPRELVDGPDTRAPAILRIDWDDGGVPIGLTKDWWTLLADTVHKMDGDTVVCCVGGHGRTGVVLAILADRLGILKDGEDPVSWVRDHYCNDAVETGAQLVYVGAMTGRQVRELPSDMFVYKGTGYVPTSGGTNSTNGMKSPTVRDLFPDYDPWDDELDDGVRRTVARRREDDDDKLLRGI